MAARPQLLFVRLPDGSVQLLVPRNAPLSVHPVENIWQQRVPQAPPRSTAELRERIIVHFGVEYLEVLNRMIEEERLAGDPPYEEIVGNAIMIASTALIFFSLYANYWLFFA